MLSRMAAPKPIAVLISDIHFTPATLSLSVKALTSAIDLSIDLDVPLIICGDTLDTKAIIRAEVANRLIGLLSPKRRQPTYMLVGNHDLLNEKGTAHALEFLRPYVQVIDRPTIEFIGDDEVALIPYQNDPVVLQDAITAVPKGSVIIMHQGVQGADMGHYVQDKTSLPRDVFGDYRVISGHYHRRQDIKTGRPRKGAVGLFSYLGNPYSLTFGEANDGPKGISILLDNGHLEFRPLNLRKHIVVTRTIDNLMAPVEGYAEGDLAWLKVYGSRIDLAKVKKKDMLSLFAGNDFKLDKIVDTEEATPESEAIKGESDGERFDRLIDARSNNIIDANALKKAWRTLYETG